jgi:hypothetical protein
MREIYCRDGTLIVSEDADDGNEITIAPVIRTFTPIRDAAYCACGAPIAPWSLRDIAGGAAELCCLHCHRVLGVFGLGVRTHL